MKNTIPKKIPLLFSRPKKIPASFIDPKKSLLAKMSDPKKSFGPPLSLKYVSGAPGSLRLVRAGYHKRLQMQTQASIQEAEKFSLSCFDAQVLQS